MPTRLSFFPSRCQKSLHWFVTSAGFEENICSKGLQKMKTDKIFTGSLLLAFVFTVSLLTATGEIVGRCQHPIIAGSGHDHASCAWRGLLRSTL
jgi:hypothetical protein